MFKRILLLTLYLVLQSGSSTLTADSGMPVTTSLVVTMEPDTHPMQNRVTPSLPAPGIPEPGANSPAQASRQGANAEICFGSNEPPHR